MDRPAQDARYEKTPDSLSGDRALFKQSYCVTGRPSAQPTERQWSSAASWSVPVHIFTRDATIARRFIQAGFQPGLRPKRPALTRMDGLNRLLLEALDSNGGVTR